MRLKKIKLAGFKSFVDPTTVPFPGALVGVVGPNGCGKSNIIDAVRWVLGESSARHLRGEAMADVIFNGSTARRPVGQASVELVFDNSDGGAGGPYAAYAEISVKRQVSRDGQSVYYLNGSRCRRKDITDLFLGTGLGPRSYAIIEQGTISRLVEARPEELRVFLEEAAGISKYKERRRETELRMRHTRENLDRLEDLRRELEARLQTLQRQARTAERYKALKAEERAVEGQLLALRWRGLREELAEREREAARRETALEGARARLREVEARLEAQREAHHRAGEAFQGAQAAVYEVGARLARAEQALQHAREGRERQRRELEAVRQELAEAAGHQQADRERIGALEAELAERQGRLAQAEAGEAAAGAALEEAEAAMQAWQEAWERHGQEEARWRRAAEVEGTRIRHLEEQLARLASRARRLEEELAGLAEGPLEAELAGAQAALAEAEEALRVQGEEAAAARGEAQEARAAARALRERLEAVQAELHRLRGRRASLEALQEEALGTAREGRQAWLRERGLAQAAPLARRLRVEPGWERAVEAALGRALEAWCVPRLGPLLEELAALEGEALTLVEDGPEEGGAGHGGKAGGGSLAARVAGPAPVRALLAGCHGAADLAEARALVERLGPGATVVTREGLLLGPGWARGGGRRDEASSVLLRQRALEELGGRVAELEAEEASLRRRLGEARARAQEGESRREAAEAALRALEGRRAEARARRERLHERLEQLRARRAGLERELEGLAEERRQGEEALAAARAGLEGLLAQGEGLEGARAELEARRERLRAALEEARARASAAREGRHAEAVRVGELRTQLATTREGLGRAARRVELLEELRRALEEALAGGEVPLQEQARAIQALLEERRGAEGRLREAREALAEAEQALRALEARRAEAEGAVEEAREALGQARLALEGLRVRLQGLAEQLAEGGHEPEALLQGLPPEAEEKAWEARLAELRGRIQRLGAVNLAAIEDYREHLQRKEYLDAQQADLSEALGTLEAAIRRIDRETRQRFQETFDRVNAGFQRLFPRLFGGGQARLEMTGEDLLEAGVAVLARPPGKRNSTIHLLSGGEKALTAVALVFAIFELNPAPFCMLDEVDAPLDDANVGRYGELLREMAERVQLVVITHNKQTMEIMDQLVGVTMQEPGVSRLVAVDLDEAVAMAAAS